MVQNDYQQSSRVLYSFIPNTQFGKLINIAPNTLLLMLSTEFSYIDIWFTDQDNNPLEINENINLTLIIV